MRRKKHQLIELYCYICQEYDSRLYVNVQRLSNNNRPEFTDAEVLTVYLWGLSERLLTVKAIYNFTKEYLHDWFPKIPSYAAFSRRLGILSNALMELVEGLSIEGKGQMEGATYMMDSMPIVVSKAKQRKSPRVAKEICSLGYNATKKMRYYGVKVSILGRKRCRKLPFPAKVGICGANESDITMGRSLLADACDICVLGDRGYHSAPWRKELEGHNVNLITPPKRQRNSPEMTQEQDKDSRFQSRLRQPIEALFAFLQNSFAIEDAHFVRSLRGLLVFIWARIAAALFFFYS